MTTSFACINTSHAKDYVAGLDEIWNYGSAAKVAAGTCPRSSRVMKRASGRQSGLANVLMSTAPSTGEFVA